MNDKDLRSDVVTELDWEPSVDSADIGVTVDNGVVTLSGHVPTYAQKIAAETVVRRVKGVRAIVQQIAVKPTGADGDEALARRAANVLDWDVTVPRDKVRVKVANGLITLFGNVDWEYQRRAAEEAVRKLGGVTGVINEIALKPRAQPGDIRNRIVDALDRYANLEAKGIQVDVSEGKVTLSGKVRSWAERDIVEGAVWSAPGVRTVEDRVTIG